jgi:subtilisin family serine protease
MAVLDPELRLLLAEKAHLAANPSEGTFHLSPDATFNIALKFTGDIGALERAGLTLGTVIGNIAYGRITLAGLEVLASHPQVVFIEKQRRSQLQLHKSVPDIRAPQVWQRSGDNFSGYTGRGVMIGVIDTGIDFKHHTFRNADGTRIHKIWDQTLTAQGGEMVPVPITHPTIATTPTPLGYGVEYNAVQINATLNQSNPPIPVRHQDKDGHGTHVAGIAAGDGSQSGGCHGSYHYIGVATEATLIVVRMWGLSDGDKNPPNTPNNFKIDAIRYILNEARLAGRPVVINLSLGSFNQAMDGTSADCQAVDQLLRNNSTGTAIVYAAGNDADASFHATGIVPAGLTNPLELKFKIHSDDKKTRRLAITYPGSNLQIRLTSPVSGANGVINWVSSGATGTSTTANGSGAGSRVMISNDPDLISISIRPPTNLAATPPVATGSSKSGTWKIELRDSGGGATPIEAFCLFGSSHDQKSPYFLNHVTAESTLCSDASGIECISVGSYKVGGRLSGFSARGPTLDLPHRTKPEICAPGEEITSAGLKSDRREFTDFISCAVCCCDCCEDFYVDKSGTSMAAPHIAGVIALMLHKNPNLTHTEIRNFLVNNSGGKPGDTTPLEDLGWGAGKVDVKAVLDQVPQVNAPIPFSIVPDPVNNLEVLREKLLQTARGPELSELFPKHARDLWALINTNKRVATVWHRCKGPVWVRLALRMAHTPGMTIPLEVDGISLRQAARRFSAALKKYASPILLEDLRRFEPEFDAIQEGMSLEHLIDVVGNRLRPELHA